MSVDLREFSMQPDSLVSWALEEGLWDGFVKEDMSSEITRRVYDRLYTQISGEESVDLEIAKIAILASRIGCPQHLRIPLEQDIQEFQMNHVGYIAPSGLGKSFKKFWKEHKTEILIGIAAVAIVTAIAVVAITTAGTAAAGAAALGSVAAASDGLNSNSSSTDSNVKEQPTQSNNSISFNEPTNVQELISDLPSLKPFDNFQQYGSPLNIGNLDHGTSLKLFGDQYLSQYGVAPRNVWDDRLITSSEIGSSIYPNQAPSYAEFEKSYQAFQEKYQDLKNFMMEEELRSKSFIHPDPTRPINLEREIQILARNFPLYDDILPPEYKHRKGEILSFFEEFMRNADVSKDPLKSRVPNLTFTTKPERTKTCWIGGINGMNTNIAEAVDHAKYIDDLMGNQGVDWVYNRTNGVVGDLIEIIFCNLMLMKSPGTEELLIKNWTEFHEANKDNPKAKYLQLCHSQGTILTSNTLRLVPEEVAKRIFVVAIAPVTIIPEKNCGGSLNIASKNDIVPLLEGFFLASTTVDSLTRESVMNDYRERQKELIILEPHPDATGWDHEFQSPTYRSEIERILKKYIKNNGEI